MALSGLDIYKKLPKTNCGDCGVPTCLAFAMKLAAGGASLDACPYVSEEAKIELSEASAPPMRLVTIGQGENALKIGEEVVLFRHEKTFYHAPGFALLVEDGWDVAEVDARIAELKANQFDRVGQMLKADLVAVRSTSGSAEKFAEVAQKAHAAGFGVILMSEDAAALEKALAPLDGASPLIYAATAANYESLAGLSKQYGAPLAVKADSPDALAELVEKVTALGVKDIILDPGSRALGKTLESMVMLRRAALKKKFKPFGYPTITLPYEETDDEMMEAVHAAVYVMKYGGIMVLKSLPAWKALPLFVLRQNIYTDPQRPMQVDEGLYEFNGPDANAPVLVTTNFSLTYFIVSSEIEGSRMPAWLAIVDAEGLSVLTAWAAGKFVPEKIAGFIKKSGLEEKVSHREIVIPGYVAQISGELEEELGGWKVRVGPREATEIPNFLTSLAS